MFSLWKGRFLFIFWFCCLFDFFFFYFLSMVKLFLPVDIRSSAASCAHGVFISKIDLIHYDFFTLCLTRPVYAACGTPYNSRSSLVTMCSRVMFKLVSHAVVSGGIRRLHTNTHRNTVHQIFWAYLTTIKWLLFIVFVATVHRLESWGGYLDTSYGIMAKYFGHDFWWQIQLYVDKNRW